ncbi:PREDICTED: peritrophin-1-like [Priapulus caudatus]|uniref:Peritrophin-1-like n=1 Tax=Priapulus caudatus TaxID=37621 RepID=A0ABM1E6H1_PRICU|nr:PREDICTED: peritrophin-1-like [Priapulus caudatus]
MTLTEEPSSGKGKNPLLTTIKNGLPAVYELDGYVDPDEEHKPDGFYTDEKDPTKYLNISDGIVYEVQCPPGLVWNQEKRQCDWPQAQNANPN